MSLFDRIMNNGDDEEVELQPSRVHKPRNRSHNNRGEVELEDSEDKEQDSGAGLLPGMPSTDSSSSSPPGSDSNSRSDGYSGGGYNTREDKLDRVIEQNERIIELLRNINSSYDSSKRNERNDRIL